MTIITLPLQRFDLAKSSVLPVVEHAYGALETSKGRKGEFLGVGIKFDWDGFARPAQEALLLEMDREFDLLSDSMQHQLNQIDRLYVCGLAGSLSKTRSLQIAAHQAAFLRDDEVNDTSLMIMLRGGVIVLDWDPEPGIKIKRAFAQHQRHEVRSDDIAAHIKVLAYKDSSNHDCLSFSLEAARLIEAALQRSPSFRGLPGAGDMEFRMSHLATGSL